MIFKKMSNYHCALISLLISMLSQVSHAKSEIYTINGKHYRVAEFLGGGLSGIAHKACLVLDPLQHCTLPTDSQKWLVAKELYKKSPDDDFIRERFALKRTERYVSSAKHYGDENKRVLIFNFTGGQRMDSVLWMARHDSDKIDRLIKAYMGGLRLFHRQYSLIHNDPHPGNCFMQDDGRVIFIDFGKSIDSDRLSADSRSADEERDFDAAKFTITHFLAGEVNF